MYIKPSFHILCHIIFLFNQKKHNHNLMYDKQAESTAAEHGFADTTETTAELYKKTKLSFFFFHTTHFSMRKSENFRQSPIKNNSSFLKKK